MAPPHFAPAPRSTSYRRFAIRTRGKAGVHEEQGNTTANGLPKKVGPNFGFDENDGFGVKQGQSRVDVGGKIDGIIDFFDVHGQLAGQFAHAGGSGGRYNNLDVGHPDLERLDQLGADIDFTDTDSMEPDHVTIRDSLLDFGAVGSETLTEALSPIAPAPHLEEVKRG